MADDISLRISDIMRRMFEIVRPSGGQNEEIAPNVSRARVSVVHKDHGIINVSVDTYSGPLEITIDDQPNSTPIIDVSSEVIDEGAAGRPYIALPDSKNGSAVDDADPSAMWTDAHAEFPELLNRVEQNLSAIRSFAETIEMVRPAINRGHNNPPELLDIPEIDTLAIDAALSAVPVLRAQANVTSPDPTLLEIALRSLIIGARAIGRFVTWAGAMGMKAAAKYIDNILDSASKSLGKSLGTAHGLATWGALACGVANGADNDLKLLIEIVKAVRTGAFGH